MKKPTPFQVVILVLGSAALVLQFLYFGPALIRSLFERNPQVVFVTSRTIPPYSFRVVKISPIPSAVGGPWVCRVGGEMLVLSLAPEPTRPMAGATVQFKDPVGLVLGGGRLDSCGAFRGEIPEGTGIVTLRYTTGLTSASNLPAGGTDPGLLSDHETVRPGDRLRICVRSAGNANPILRTEFDGEPLLPEEAGSPRWRVFSATIPDDARPGTVVVEFGGETLEIPVLSRFSQGADADGGGGSPDTPPLPPDPGTQGEFLLEQREGRWHAMGPADVGLVLFYAESGGRLLAHQAVAAMDGLASVDLPLGENPPAAVRVTAVAATGKRFLEASVGDPGTPAPPMDDDAVLSAFLASKSLPEPAPTGPAWIHEGDTTPGMVPPPPVRPGFLARGESAVVRPGERTAVPAPGDTPVQWELRPAGVEGSLRIRAGETILLETRKSAGVLRAAEIGDLPVLVESNAPGFESVLFRWTVAEAAAELPARPAQGISVERTLPGRGKVGDEVMYTVVIHSRSPVAVVCPIPRGAVLAEDGWSIRSRAPAGTRVETPDGAVVLRVPGDASLSFRIRLARAGRYAAPAVAADSARSASGFLVIE